jgi:CRISPR-associated exonuclease Cas4
MNVEIPEGELFYGQTRRREDVIFDEELRLETEDAAKNVHGQYLSPTFARCAICVTL